MKPRLHLTCSIVILFITMGQTLYASDVVSSKSIGMELARDIANESVLACRNQGYNVSAVVVDRFGLMRAALRDDLAARFSLEIAERKANMTVVNSESYVRIYVRSSTILTA